MKTLFLLAISALQLGWPQSTLANEALNQCEPIQLGQSVRVHQTAFGSPTSLPRLYEIERDVENESVYHINVPLELVVQETFVSTNHLGETSTNYLSPNDVLEHIAGSENLDQVEVKTYVEAQI